MDTNCIINNNVINEKTNTITYKIIFNIKNYLYNDKNINIIEYINQIIWFHKHILNTLFDNILENIKDYIIYNRINIRNSINNNNYNIHQLCNYIETFDNKIKYLNLLFKFNIVSKNTNIIYKIYEYLYDYIINDPIINTIIEKYILIQIEKNENELIIYFKLLQRIYISELKFIYLNYIKYINLIIYTNYIDKFNINLPDNIKYISMLHNNNTIITKISTNLPYIYNDIIIYLVSYLNNNIINIIENNNIFEIYNIFQNENNNQILNLLIFNDELIDKIINLIFISSNKDILYIYRFINKLFNTCKLLNLYINKIYDKLYDKIYLILDDTNLLNNILFDIHLILINNNNTSKNLFLINKIIRTFSNNDIFNNIYIKYVKLRCMFYYEKFIKKTLLINDVLFKLNSELTLLSTINILNISLGTIVKNIVNDIQHSINYTISSIEPNINTIITSQYWEINDNGINIESLNNNNNIKNTILGKYILDFSNTYIKNNNDERKLYWYLHYGNVNITYLDKHIKILPIHLIILNIICDNEFKLSDFKSDNFLNLYSLEFIDNLLNSLLTSKLIVIKNEILYMNESNDFDTDIINIFLTNFYNKKNIITNNDLSHSYKYIIMANVNHILKSQSLHYNKLFHIIKKNNILALIDKKLFENTLNYMVEMEYIMVNDLIYEKLYY